MIKILLLEDDEVLSETLMELLDAKEYLVSLAKDAKEVLNLTYETKFDLYLFDVNVPFISGFELLKSLRESGDKTPAIFITALSDIDSISKGFEVGVDDYIKKPFNFDELFIRIKAMLKRNYKSYEDFVNFGSFKFDIQNEQLYKEDKQVQLTPYENKITKLLSQNIDKIVTKDMIYEFLGDGKEISEGALRVHIASIRKIGLSIKTIKGVGYKLENL